MAIKCHPGGRFKVSVEIELPNGVPALPPGYSFYAEYTGPIGDVGVGDTVLKTDESASGEARGKKVVLEGFVPRDARLGVYNLSHFERRFSTEAGVARNIVPVEDIPYVAELFVEATPADRTVAWPAVNRVG